MQMEVAHRLADHYGHEWARCWNVATCPLDTEAIAEGVYAARERQVVPGVPGIAAPQVMDGAIVHVSSTGRLCWTVDETGFTVLSVSRPAGEVLTAFVHPGDVTRATVQQSRHVPCHARHVAALRDALCCIIGQHGETLCAAIPALPD